LHVHGGSRAKSHKGERQRKCKRESEVEGRRYTRRVKDSYEELDQRHSPKAYYNQGRGQEKTERRRMKTFRAAAKKRVHQGESIPERKFQKTKQKKEKKKSARRECKEIVKLFWIKVGAPCVAKEEQCS